MGAGNSADKKEEDAKRYKEAMQIAASTQKQKEEDAKRYKEAVKKAERKQEEAEARRRDTLRQKKEMEHKMIDETDELRRGLAEANDNLAAQREERDALRRENDDLETKLGLWEKRDVLALADKAKQIHFVSRRTTQLDGHFNRQLKFMRGRQDIRKILHKNISDIKRELSMMEKECNKASEALLRLLSSVAPSSKDIMDAVKFKDSKYRNFRQRLRPTELRENSIAEICRLQMLSGDVDHPKPRFCRVLAFCSNGRYRVSEYLNPQKQWEIAKQRLRPVGVVEHTGLLTKFIQTGERQDEKNLNEASRLFNILVKERGALMAVLDQVRTGSDINYSKKMSQMASAWERYAKLREEEAKELKAYTESMIMPTPDGVGREFRPPSPDMEERFKIWSKKRQTVREIEKELNTCVKEIEYSIFTHIKPRILQREKEQRSSLEDLKAIAQNKDLLESVLNVQSRAQILIRNCTAVLEAYGRVYSEGGLIQKYLEIKEEKHVVEAKIVGLNNKIKRAAIMDNHTSVSECTTRIRKHQNELDRLERQYRAAVVPLRKLTRIRPEIIFHCGDDLDPLHGTCAENIPIYLESDYKLDTKEPQFSVRSKSARVQAKVSHPNIIRLQGICKCHDGNWTLDLPRYRYTLPDWAVAKKAEIQTKFTRVEEQKRQWSGIVARVMRGILKGLLHLHENNVIHRDIKPDNILVERLNKAEFQSDADSKVDRDVAVIADLETCISYKPGASSQPQTVKVGTQGYIDPQANMGLAPAADMFAYGVTLGEVLTGKQLRSPQDVDDCKGLGDAERDILKKLLCHDRGKRVSSRKALSHDYFTRGPAMLQTCCICYGDFPPEEGVQCSGGPSGKRHFYCSSKNGSGQKSCFDRLVLDMATDSLKVRTERKGQVCCKMSAEEEPRFDVNRRAILCRSCPFSEKVVCCNTLDEVYEKHRSSNTEISKYNITKAAEKLMEEKLKAERKRLREMDEAARQVYETKQKIFDEILPIIGDIKSVESLANRCPNCGLKFQEFSACFKIKCRECRVDFCGWCMRRCETVPDPHEHVRQCPKNRENGNLFSTKEKYEESNFDRRKTQLQALFRECKKETAITVLVESMSDFKALGFGGVAEKILNPLLLE
eukprot:jgi/Bigna1/91123/estExt_fgenesh1_pg.C_890039